MIFFRISKLFVGINFWQHPTKLSTSAAALFDTVLIERHIPHAAAGSSLWHVPLPLSCVSSVDDHVPRCDSSSQTSSAFSDSWSYMESPDIRRKPYIRAEDLLSEMGSVCSSEASTLVDESFNEWPFVQIRDCHPRNLTSRRLPVTENFVAELKPRAPVSHGLLRVSGDSNWATLSVRPVELMRPCANENGSCGTGNTVERSHCGVPLKRKEVILSVSTVKSSVCSIEETRTVQKVIVGGFIADGIRGDGGQLPEWNLNHDTATSECTVKNGHTDDSEHQTVLLRCMVEPEFSTVWTKDEDCCRTRLEVCRREFVSCRDLVSSCSKHKTDKDAAVQLLQQLTSPASFKTASQMTTVPADGVSPATVQPKKVCIVKNEPCDIDTKVPVIVRYSGGRSHSAEQLSEDKHSSHPVNNSSPRTVQMMKSLSDLPSSVDCFSNELHRSEDCIYRQSIKCRRGPDNNYFDGQAVSASWDNVADLNEIRRSKVFESQDDVDSKITECNLRSHYRKEQQQACSDTEVNNHLQLVKDVSAASRSRSDQRRLTVIRGLPSIRTQYYSCDRLLPDASGSPRYIGRHHLYLGQQLKSASCESVSTVRPVKSKNNLELLPTLWVLPLKKIHVVQPTVLTPQSLSTPRTRCLLSSSEPHNINGVMPDIVLSHTSTSSPDVSSHSSECKNSRSRNDDEYRNDVMGVHSVERTSLGADVALKYDSDSLHMYCCNLSDMVPRCQAVMHCDSDGTDRTIASQSENNDDNDAGMVVLEHQLQDSCRLNGFKSRNLERDTKKQPLVESADGFHQLDHSAAVRSEDLLPVGVSRESMLNPDIDKEDSFVTAGAIRDENKSTDRFIDSVSDTAMDSSVWTVTACDDVSAEMFSSRVVIHDDCSDSAAEKPLSVSALNCDVTESDSVIVIDAIVADPQSAQVSTLATESDVVSEITVHDHSYQTTVPLEEICRENSDKPATIVRSYSDDITGDGDVQLGITCRREFIQSVCSGDSLLHEPVRNNEVLDTVSFSSDCLADMSSQISDLSESLATSISWPSSSSFVDDRLHMTPASHEVNSKLRSGDTSMSTPVWLAYLQTADNLAVLVTILHANLP